MHAYTAGNEPYELWEGLDRRSPEYKRLKVWPPAAAPVCRSAGFAGCLRKWLEESDLAIVVQGVNMRWPIMVYAYAFIL